MMMRQDGNNVFALKACASLPKGAASFEWLRTAINLYRRKDVGKVNHAAADALNELP